MLLYASLVAAHPAGAAQVDATVEAEGDTAASLRLGDALSCRTPDREIPAGPLPDRCVLQDASFILQTPLDRPESLIVGWAPQGIDFIGGLMRILDRSPMGGARGGAPALVVLVPRDQLSVAHRSLSRFPEYSAFRRSGRLLLRPTQDDHNLWMQDAMEIGWNPQTGGNSVADLPHFASDTAARSVAVACGLEKGLFFGEPGRPAPSITDTSRNHGGNLEGLPGNILLHGRGTSGVLLGELRRSNPALEVLTVETHWLEVGHVDELFAIIPTAPQTDASDRCGFALLRASPGLALELIGNAENSSLEPELRDFFGVPPEARTTRTCMDRLSTTFDGSPLSAKKALGCRAFSQANREFEALVARDAERVREAIARRTGCTSIPIVRLPALFLPGTRASERALNFEAIQGMTATAAFRAARSLNPNPVNGISLGEVLIVPEQPNPSFRESILESLKKAAPGLRVEFISTHHLHFLEGEAHCGTQVIRSCTSEL